MVESRPMIYIMLEAAEFSVVYHNRTSSSHTLGGAYVQL